MSTPASIGVTFASLGALGVPAALEVAKDAEELGYSSFWTAEANGTEAFGLLGAVGQATRSIGLGTGVIPVTLRTPPLAAMAAATLQALTPERDILLGIGISSPVVAGQWHGAPYSSARPLAQTREYLTLLRECLSGESVTFSGDFYQVKKFRMAIRLGNRRPKVILAALNQGMLRLGGELADGVLLNYLPAHYVPASIEHVRAGGNAPVYAYVHAGVVPDRSVGIDAARRDLFSYAMAPAYAAMFEAAGYADEIGQMRECNDAGDRDGAVQAMSDRMVDEINTMGDEQHVHRFVESYRAAGVDVPVLMTLPWGSDRRAITTATIRAAIGAF